LIDRLVIFGGTGDLTGRFLIPALAAMRKQGRLSERFELVAASQSDWDDERFRSWAADWLEREAPDADAADTTALLRSSRYQRLDLGEDASVGICRR
jgi:glucose-6-phosphate 1-dehydrogenase